MFRDLTDYGGINKAVSDDLWVLELKCKFIDNHKQENYLCFKNPTTKEQFKYLMRLSAPYFYSQIKQNKQKDQKC